MASPPLTSQPILADDRILTAGAQLIRNSMPRPRRIIHKALDHVSPLSVPVLLEIGRETVYGEASDTLLAEAADELIKEAMR